LALDWCVFWMVKLPSLELAIPPGCLPTFSSPPSLALSLPASVLVSLQALARLVVYSLAHFSSTTSPALHAPANISSSSATPALTTQQVGQQPWHGVLLVSVLRGAGGNPGGRRAPAVGVVGALRCVLGGGGRGGTGQGREVLTGLAEWQTVCCHSCELGW
jgi:hypothetical protein